MSVLIMEYQMAQPAGNSNKDNRTDLEIPVYKASASADLAWLIKTR